MKLYNTVDIINAVMNENAKLIKVYGVYSYWMLEFPDGSYICKLRKRSPEQAQEKMKGKTKHERYNGSYKNGHVIYKG